MAEILQFSESYNYNTLLPGISLPIILRSGDNTAEIHAKLDTGASNCIFEREIGEVLGLDIEKGERILISTATGSFGAYAHRIEMITFGFLWEATVFFIAEEGIKRNVLGRNGWLDRVKLGLIDYEGKLLLSPAFDDYQD